jgi:hypothetical protein
MRLGEEVRGDSTMQTAVPVLGLSAVVGVGVGVGVGAIVGHGVHGDMVTRASSRERTRTRTRVRACKKLALL